MAYFTHLQLEKAYRGYEIVAGQRRYLALKSLGRETAPCRIISVTDTVAETISLTENTHRSQLTTADKIRIYNRLYQIHDGNLAKVAKLVSITVPTLTKYINIAALPTEILVRLDSKGDNRITVETATALTKVPPAKVLEVAAVITPLATSAERGVAIKQITGELAKRELSRRSLDVEEMEHIVDDLRIDNLKEKERVAPVYPWVPGMTGTPMMIPPTLFKHICALIKKEIGH